MKRFEETLSLKAHIEGGWCRRTWAGPPADGEGSSAASAIYYAIDPERELIWHRVGSWELWFYQSGSPTEVILGGTGSDPREERRMVLGPDPEKGQSPQLVIPPDTWQKQKAVEDRQALCSCAVVPGFSFGNWEAIGEDGRRIGEKDALRFEETGGDGS